MSDYHQLFSRAAVLEGYSKATLAVGLDPIALLKQSDIDPYCLRYPDFKIPTASIIQLLRLFIRSDRKHHSRAPSFSQ